MTTTNNKGETMKRSEIFTFCKASYFTRLREYGDDDDSLSEHYEGYDLGYVYQLIEADVTALAAFILQHTGEPIDG